MKITNTTRTLPIVIDKPEPRGRDLVCLSFVNTYKAMAELSPVAFTLYMYLVLRDDKEQYQLSDISFLELTGFSYEDFVDAYDELIAGSFLTINERGSDLRYFHDVALEPPYWDEATIGNRSEWEELDAW